MSILATMGVARTHERPVCCGFAAETSVEHRPDHTLTPCLVAALHPVADVARERRHVPGGDGGFDDDGVEIMPFVTGSLLRHSRVAPVSCGLCPAARRGASGSSTAELIDQHRQAPGVQDSGALGEPGLLVAPMVERGRAHGQVEKPSG